MRLHDRLFKALLRLLPAEFRGDYERDMTAMFRAQRRAAHSSGALLRVWIATVVDVFRTAPSEHMDILRRDLSYTVRMLWRRPMLTTAAVITLALGIGANAMIFSVVDGVLFAPLPYPESDRLVRIQETRRDTSPGTTGYFSFDTVRAENRSLSSVAAYAYWSAIFSGGGKDAERVLGARLTWNFFRTLGLKPAYGHDFEQGEDHPERRRVVIISDALWRRRYGADPTVIGKPITINQATYTLAGIMPARLTELVTQTEMPNVEIWTLLGYADGLPQACRSCRHIHVVGRLKSGVSVEEAEADVTHVYESLSHRYPSDYDHPRAVLTPVRAFFLGPVRTPLYLLWGAVGVLLMMTCANIANLLLIRASERDEEMAIRRALGVSPARMLRQLLTEALVLAVAGCVTGTVLAWYGTSALVAYGPESIPRLSEVSVNARVLLYAVAISLATGILFGLAPARVLIGRDATSSQMVASRRTTSTAAAWKYRAALITFNVALSALLLVGSGLLVRSFMRLLTVDPGFNSGQLLTLRVDLSGQTYREIPAITRFYDEVISRIAAVPDVDAVTTSTQLALTGAFDRSGITIEGRVYENPAAAPYADRYAVRPQYFTTLGIPLLAGRLFTDADRAGAEPVAIIGTKMAHDLWPGEDPIGRRIRVAGGQDNPMRTIVGIVGDIRHYGLHMPETLQVYIPHAQTIYPEPTVSVVIRARQGRDPLSLASIVRDQIRGIDPLQPVIEIRTFDEIVSESMATRRFTLVLLALFAGTALILAVVGLYGALSYVVSQRQREIGVRVALGASAREISRLVLRQGMTPAGLGLGGGLLVSLGTGRLVESMLYGTSPTDATTFAVVVAVMSACALAACLIPARRAAGVDPAVTLRDSA
jgi:putative ABC transport system permease protein